MLKIIGRVLKLSGNLSRRIWGSFICGFLDVMLGMLPIGAVFYALTQLHNGSALTVRTWTLVIALILTGLFSRMLFKYLVYRLQSTAGFEFVSRERITLGQGAFRKAAADTVGCGAGHTGIYSGNLRHQVL